MINSKQKGKRIELELVHWLKENGCPSARRTEQYNGKEGLSDVVTNELPNFHIESKGTQSPTIPKSILIKWLEQIKRDCPEKMHPVIFTKANNTDWIGILPCSVYHTLNSKPRSYQYPMVLGAVGNSINPSEELQRLLLHKDVWPAAHFNLRATVGYRIGDDILIFADAKEMLQAMMEFETIDTYFEPEPPVAP